MAVKIPTYAHEMGKAIPGQLLGTTEHVVLSRLAGEEIAFGSAVFGTTGDGQVVMGKDSTGALPFLGIAAFNQTVEGCYPKDKMVSVVNEGMVYVKVAKAVKANKPVFVTKADGTFAAEAGSSEAVEVSAMYLEDGNIGDIVAILVK